MSKNKDVEIHKDFNNPKHEPHYDVTVRIPSVGGADHMRVREDGSVINGETCIGKAKMQWEPQ